MAGDLTYDIDGRAVLGEREPQRVVKDDETQDLQLHNKILVTEEEIRSLGLEITRVRQVLDQLLKRRLESTEQLEALRETLAPIKKLPSEILGEIFLICGASQPIRIPSTRNSTSFPWNFAHVCSRWRHTVQTDQRLWNNVEIVYNHVDDIPVVDDTAADVFSRSGPMLSLAVTTSPSILSAHPHAAITNFLTLTVPHTPLRSLSLTLSDIYMQVFLTLPRGSLDSLESVELIIVEPNFIATRFDFVQYNVTVLDGAPNLRKVSLGLKSRKRADDAPPGADMDLDQLRFPWNQLTALSFSKIYISTRTAHSILRRCPRLKHCTMALTSQKDNFSPFSHKTLVLPNLESIEFTTPSTRAPFPWDQFLELFLFPSLKHVTSRTNDLFNSDWLLSLIERSNCVLEALELTWISSDDLEELLKRIPSLRIFKTQSELPASLFDSISERLVSPNLKHITGFVDGESLNAFLDMIEAYDAPSHLSCDGLISAFLTYTAGPWGLEETLRLRFMTLARKVKLRGRYFEVV